VAPNPFVFDRPVAPGDLIDRRDEIATVVANLEGGANTRLSSPRRYGKTSVLGAALAEAERLGMARVYVDLYGARTVGQVHARVERAYERELKGPVARAFAGLKRGFGGGAITTPVGGGQLPAAGAPTERALLDLLDMPLSLHERTGTRIALAFDEFQDILGAGQDVDALMRSVIQHHGDAASYVFAGSHPGLMASLFGDRSRPFYGQAAPLVLNPLSDDDLAGYIGSRFEATRREPGRALGWLLALVEGHPQRAMLLAHLLWAGLEPGEAADEATWGMALDSAERFLRDEFVGAWDALSPVERGVIEAVASGAAGLTSGETLQRFGLTKGGAPPAAARLESAGILAQDRGRPAGYRLVDPLFAQWVAGGRGWRA
jgi:hypothetical protein